MISRDFISGFFFGSGLTGICYGLYLLYVGNKLIQLSKKMKMEMETNETNEVKNIQDVD